MGTIPRRKTERTCPVCGKVFLRRADQKSNNCSMACANRTRTRPIGDRFWKWVDKNGPDGCWLWHGAGDRYGRVNVGEGMGKLSHRVSWELANGPIPDGQEVLHRCDTPRCVNPSHLFLGTQAENMHDMKHKGRGRRPRQ